MDKNTGKETDKMDEVKTNRRTRTVMELPAATAEKLIAAQTRQKVAETVLDKVTGEGVPGMDVTTQAAADYFKAVQAELLEAAQAVDEAKRDVLALAKEHGYDPATCTPINMAGAGDTGAVSWTGWQECADS